MTLLRTLTGNDGLAPARCGVTLARLQPQHNVLRSPFAPLLTQVDLLCAKIQDDYLDAFGDPEVIGKIGTDIEDNKCSWLVVQALERADPEQRAVIEVPAAAIPTQSPL